MHLFVNLRSILSHTLWISHVQEIANLEVSSQSLHSVFLSLLHYLRHLLKGLFRQFRFGLSFLGCLCC